MNSIDGRAVPTDRVSAQREQWTAFGRIPAGSPDDTREPPVRLPMMFPSLFCALSVASTPSPSMEAPSGIESAAVAFAPQEDMGADTFMAAMEGAGLMQELRSLAAAGEPMMLLRPTDAAFGGLSPELMTSLFDEDNRRPLRELLLGHVIVGSAPAIDYLQQGSAQVRSGEAISVGLEGGVLCFGGAPVLMGPRTADDPGAGFIVYEIGAVIGFDAARFQRSPAQRIAEDGLEAADSVPQALKAAFLTLSLRSVLELEPSNAVAEAALAMPEAQRTASRLSTALESIREGRTTLPMNDDSTPLITFSRSEDEPGWFTLNDDVMGGISKSRFTVSEEGVGVFTGALSLENNGGFASIRSNDRGYELDGYKGLRVRVRGDGREYGLSALSADGRGRVGSWRKRFTTKDGEWETIDVPFAEMVLNIRGRRYPDVGPPRQDRVRSFSFIIGDKNTEPFQLEIDSISAYR